MKAEAEGARARAALRRARDRGEEAARGRGLREGAEAPGRGGRAEGRRGDPRGGREGGGGAEGGGRRPAPAARGGRGHPRRARRGAEGPRARAARGAGSPGAAARRRHARAREGHGHHRRADGPPGRRGRGRDLRQAPARAAGRAGRLGQQQPQGAWGAAPPSSRKPEQPRRLGASEDAPLERVRCSSRAGPFERRRLRPRQAGPRRGEPDRPDGRRGAASASTSCSTTRRSPTGARSALVHGFGAGQAPEGGGADCSRATRTSPPGGSAGRARAAAGRRSWS